MPRTHPNDEPREPVTSPKPAPPQSPEQGHPAETDAKPASDDQKRKNTQTR